ncbi:uncharacterized protein BO97DRAFT_426360 [Aspergillus homomorphus CBS 101889]|uniref:Uncharacterized protein n=1 Tax=Aspergillus homomorphus (strain CBS 101889) TaxID=1450537 RepID=A0A395HS40_ASPHC|nr:hypothetical protein BO97DRAFT_426360 [Aspergillus homomorphus CBS 101889]RAL10590.1 hypothetical protein BO97DRAFT_426360 [Aspergillus homomorphus CBS 101889]
MATIATTVAYASVLTALHLAALDLTAWTANVEVQGATRFSIESWFSAIEAAEASDTTTSAAASTSTDATSSIMFMVAKRKTTGPAQIINNPFPSIEGYISSSAKLSSAPSSSSWISGSMGQHGSFLSKISSVRRSPTAYVISPTGHTYTIDASHSASAPAVSPLHSSSSPGRASSVRALHSPAASDYRFFSVAAVSAATAQSETQKLEPHGVESYSSAHTVHPTSTTASIPSPTTSSAPLSFANPSAHNSTIPRKASTSSRSSRIPGR